MRIFDALRTRSDSKGVADPTLATPAERIKATGQFLVEDAALLASTHERHDFLPGTPWDDFRGSSLSPPDWFRFDLDPLSAEYSRQQHRLWCALSGVDRAYDPAIDEKEDPGVSGADAIRFPGHFVRRDTQAVPVTADHIIATGMLMKHSGLVPGQWALEYGAGFAQTALQLARLGVNVDTVDISAKFCEHVKVQSEFFGVPLTPFQGLFGENPRGDRQYDLIWFYESFHHCLDFQRLVASLKRNLAPTGRVLLAGEPVRPREDRWVPYPWGLRLDSENVAVIRYRHWFELGFTEDFLASLFTNAGFMAERLECHVSPMGEGYLFRHRPDSIQLSRQWLPSVERESWHGPEAEGRWTTGASTLTLDATDSFARLEIEATNHHPVLQRIEVRYGDVSHVQEFKPGERRVMTIDAGSKARKLMIRSKTLVPAKDYRASLADLRALGIFIHEVRYVQQASAVL